MLEPSLGQWVVSGRLPHHARQFPLQLPSSRHLAPIHHWQTLRQWSLEPAQRAARLPAKRSAGNSQACHLSDGHTPRRCSFDRVSGLPDDPLEHWLDDRCVEAGAIRGVAVPDELGRVTAGVVGCYTQRSHAPERAPGCCRPRQANA